MEEGWQVKSGKSCCSGQIGHANRAGTATKDVFDDSGQDVVVMKLEVLPHLLTIDLRFITSPTMPMVVAIRDAGSGTVVRKTGPFRFAPCAKMPANDPSLMLYFNTRLFRHEDT